MHDPDDTLTEAQETTFNLTGNLPEGWTVDSDEPTLTDAMLNEADEPEPPVEPKKNRRGK